MNDSSSLADGNCGLTDGSVASDWSLPNVKELQSVTVFSTMNPAIPAGHPFDGVESDGYWSSTTQAQDDFGGRLLASKVSLNEGNMTWNFKTDTYYVWPVREA